MPEEIEEFTSIQFNVSKEQFFKMIAQNLYRYDGTPTHEICQKIINLFEGLIAENTVRKILPSDYKNTEMALLRKGKTKNFQRKKMSKKTQFQIIHIVDDLIQMNKSWKQILYEINLMQRKGIIGTHSWNNKDTLRKWYARKKMKFPSEILRSPIKPVC